MRCTREYDLLNTACILSAISIILINFADNQNSKATLKPSFNHCSEGYGLEELVQQLEIEEIKE